MVARIQHLQTSRRLMTKHGFDIPYQTRSMQKRQQDRWRCSAETKKIAYLVQEGAFNFPSIETREVLLHAYFSWFHPCFPIVDRRALYKSYTTEAISPLLLQSLLFVGASYCSEETLRQHGYPNRHDARGTLYNYAKDIYDADYEKDKLTVSQALFLMSFWRSGPLLEKDTRHWLGSAISLAQTQGMHRS